MDEDEDQKHGPSAGHLLHSTFQHLEPSGVGVVNLDRSITPSTPDGREWEAGQRDGLLLVRLHDDPIAVVHIDGALGVLSREELATQIWQSAGAEIRRHVERCGCARTPEGPDALIGGIPWSAECPGPRPKLDLSVAVIVPTVGREEQLGRCIRSLLAQRAVEFEVIVVDNRPATERALRTVSTLASEDSRVRYLAEPRPGSSVARNLGINKTDAELVAFTDDDVVVDPSWLEWLIAPFAERQVNATCGLVLPLELQTAAQKRFERHGGFSKGLERRSYDLHSGQDASLPLYPFLGDAFGSGNSMAFRRAELIAADGFDPALGGGTPARSGEDIYAFSTVILREGTLVYEPRALCWHEHRKDDDELRRQVFDYGVGLGAIMTKALLSGDPRFVAATARSVRGALGQARQKHVPAEEHSVNGSASTSDDYLLRTQRAGMLRGPLRYATGVARARKLGINDVIRGG